MRPTHVLHGIAVGLLLRELLLLLLALVAATAMVMPMQQGCAARQTQMRAVE